MHQSNDSKQKELSENMFDFYEDEDETIEQIFDSDGDFIYAKPSTKTETET